MFMEKSWKELLKQELDKPYMQDLQAFLAQEHEEGKTIYPKESEVFQAFCFHSFQETSVVIIGQDPYHNEGQAHGLSFSVKDGVRQPPSLKNIFEEIRQDLSLPMSSKGCLDPWAKQGVLLLNTILTVRKNEPKSHHNQGWEVFTDKVVELLAAREKPLVFLLWGKSAREKCAKVNAPHLCLEAAHPSPYSAHSGFFGCRHFSKANQFLKEHSLAEIDWRI